MMAQMATARTRPIMDSSLEDSLSGIWGHAEVCPCLADSWREWTRNGDGLMAAVAKRRMPACGGTAIGGRLAGKFGSSTAIHRTWHTSKAAAAGRPAPLTRQMGH